MNIQQLLEEHQIQFQKSGKHSRAGWLQIKCPFCSGHPGWHGGFNLAGNYYNCWRCGWHPIDATLAEILNLSRSKVRSLLKSIKNTPISFQNRAENQFSPLSPTYPLSLPKKAQNPGVLHKSFLRQRGFSPDPLIREWKLLGTGPTGDYKFRLIAPIYFQGDLVSFQGRDVTGKQEPAYKACPKNQEKILHQNLIYGLDKIRYRRGIIVEGLIDAWKLGPGAGATFGQEISKSQIRMLVEFLDNIYILFDSEYQAQKNAEALAEILYIGYNKTVEILSLAKHNDPGELSEVEGKDLLKSILKY